VRPSALFEYRARAGDRWAAHSVASKVKPGSGHRRSKSVTCAAVRSSRPTAKTQPYCEDGLPLGRGYRNEEAGLQAAMTLKRGCAYSIIFHLVLAQAMHILFDFSVAIAL